MGVILCFSGAGGRHFEKAAALAWKPCEITFAENIGNKEQIQPGSVQSETEYPGIESYLYMANRFSTKFSK